MGSICVLGAEKQAATSLAIAYPDQKLMFISDSEILDGWNIANVRIRKASLSEATTVGGCYDLIVPLCPRWLTDDYSLSRAFAHLERKLPGRCQRVQRQLPNSGLWLVKGDRWHWPDIPVSGTAAQLAQISDAHGCGLVFQPYRRVDATVMVIGRRDCASRILMGVVNVFVERFLRDDMLEAGETISDSDLVELSLEVLEVLDHRGFFTLNWLRTDNGLKLSSFRPVPRAVFQSFLRAGIDLLGVAADVKVARPGIRFIASPTYLSYKRLCP